MNAWVWQKINVGTVYRAFVPKKKIKVAIIDGSFDLEHPVLKGFIGNNEKEIPDNNIDDDQNGLIDDAAGWDFADADNDVLPQSDKYNECLHATRVADVFVQTVHQLVPDAEKFISILPLKTRADKANNNYITVGYKAIEYAIAQHVDIILCCWAGTMVNAEQKKILQKATNAGIVIVATAGNFFLNEQQYPGAYPDVICVTALTKNSTRQNVSNYGNFTDIAAPGDSIATITNKSQALNGMFSGTSAAAPIVAGVVAAIKATGYKGNILDIDRLLKNSATPVDQQNSLYAGKLGAGIVNIAALYALLKNGVDEKVYKQPKAYINISRLNKEIPLKVLAAARFKDYKLSIVPAANAAAGDVRLQYFKDGVQKETVWKRTAFNRPLKIDVDSMYVFGTAATIAKTRANSYIYYEAETIDSSYFYCSGTTNIKDTAGFIEDGSGNGFYTGKNDCKWLIEVPRGKRIQIEFTEFDTEPKKDQVYIFNGDKTNAQILAIFSGPNIPPKITTGGNIALVWFITSETVHGKGWKLHYKAVD